VNLIFIENLLISGRYERYYRKEMTLDNMIFSSVESYTFKAVIDWECVGCIPFAMSVPFYTEKLF
jgi:hypothetical protein